MTFALSAGAGTVGMAWMGIGVARCETAPPNRLQAVSKKAQEAPDQHFDFAKMWVLLKENIAYLLVALGSAMAVAALNIRIPQLLGDVVNIVAEAFAQQGRAVSDSMATFLVQMRGPAKEMIKLYLSQAVLTFAYIYSLACVGKPYFLPVQLTFKRLL